MAGSTKRKAASQDIKSDEFVQSDSDEGTVKANETEEASASSSSDEEERSNKTRKQDKVKQKKKKAKADPEPEESEESGSGWSKDADGRPFKKLSEKSMKRVTISSFRGKTFVDIREYYTDKGSGQEKPGKKGIALQMDDWKSLKSTMGEIDSRLQ